MFVLQRLDHGHPATALTICLSQHPSSCRPPRSFVAHIISGSLEATLAAAFGVLNLGLAPLGLLLITRLRPRGTRVIALSLLMGAAGFVIVFLGQLLPLMASMLGRRGVEVGKLAPGEPLARATEASVRGLDNTFQMARFCAAGH